MEMKINNRPCANPHPDAWIHVWIYLDKVYEEVMMRAWWRGEAEKTKDIDAAILQTPAEAIDELRVFATTALNQIVLWALEILPAADMEFFDDNRVPLLWIDVSGRSNGCHPSVTVEGEMARLTFASSRPDVEQPLRRAVFDYLVQYVLWKWALAVRPDIAAEYQAAIDEYASRLQNILHLAGNARIRRKYRLFGI